MLVTLKAVRQPRRNAKEWPEFYTCNFLTPGLVSYEDIDAGIAYLSKETILKMLPSFKGKPVIDRMHKDVTPRDFEEHAVGYITRVWYDDFINWACCEFILTDDKAKESVAKGYAVSCAYDDCLTGPGGEKNAVRYDEEILDGCGNHLALVENPRYEEAKISPSMMLVNSRKASVKRACGEATLTFARNAVKRICDGCEYLEQGKCSVAGPGGEITQRYADLRINGQEQECSAYERAAEPRMKENSVLLTPVKQ